MQISGFPIVTPSPSPSARLDATERLQKPVQRETNRTEDERPNAALDEGRANREAEQQSRIASATEISGVNNRPQFEEEGLTRSAQRALEAFASNAPSPSQQLGIELAGIDVYV